MRTEIILIIDTSTSMYSIKPDMEGGYEEFMATRLRDALEHPEDEVFATLVEFSDKVRTVYEGIPITDVPKWELIPLGMTALRDGIGVGLSQAKARFSKLDKQPDAVLVLIITDGQENSSREMSASAVQSCIEDAKKSGWAIQFLGSNEASVNWASNNGIKGGVQIGTSGNAARASFMAASSGTSTYMNATRGCVSMGLSPDQIRVQRSAAAIVTPDTYTRSLTDLTDKPAVVRPIPAVRIGAPPPLKK